MLARVEDDREVDGSDAFERVAEVCEVTRHETFEYSDHFNKVREHSPVQITLSS